MTTSQEAKATCEAQKPPPKVGERYRFVDFLGASFVATFTGHETVQLEDGPHLRLHFEDRGDFTTNLPIDYEPVSS